MGGVQKQLTLDLGSSLPPAGPPQASHAIPPVMNMGKALALRSPKPVAPSQPQSHEREPEHRDFERPKGRILLFWGCGETAHAKQPVVFDFSKLAAGQPPPNMFAGETVRVVSHDGKFLAWAAFSPSSTIRLRVWSNDEAEHINADFFA